MYRANILKLFRYINYFRMIREIYKQLNELQSMWNFNLWLSFKIRSQTLSNEKIWFKDRQLYWKYILCIWAIADNLIIFSWKAQIHYHKYTVQRQKISFLFLSWFVCYIASYCKSLYHVFVARSYDASSSIEKKWSLLKKAQYPPDSLTLHWKKNLVRLTKWLLENERSRNSD